MSLNWVMLSGPGEFIRLPSEQVVYKSPVRTSFLLQNHRTFPGREPYSVNCAAGHVILTNQRVIYLPQITSGRRDLLPDETYFESFAAPLTNLHDSHVTAPWLGPNAWVAVVQPVPSGGISPNQTALELKLTFKDGGAYDFHEKFVRLRERMAQAREAAATTGASAGTIAANVHLEDLPVYEERPRALQAQRGDAEPVQQRQQRDIQTEQPQPTLTAAAATSQQVVPDEPPPGYEEAQMASVSGSLETEMRRRLQAGESHG